ncbi:MAG: hypothetical protein ACTH0V_02450 [Microbacteriaceae bacterium]|uniref:hypothetical protein n=1 Tax=unclassified Microbacterium TaxID=2609290 RepID=UPI00097F5857|nr:hypothetical protein [Microbacterium sp. JB110]RCS60892.1 hypothetical protein CIK77_09520 [Microbacterium sp. JB110]SJM64212.1 hypothetical protein CZ774_12590 [Frigoribacterium sp. JB110]
MTETRSVAKRLTVALPLLGAALILSTLFLPTDFASTGWALGGICFAVALVCAVRVVRSGRPAQRRR